MAKVHMILQGKGGVGKSFIASILAQHYYAKKKNVLCIDTDPVNATFHGFKKLNVQRLDLMEGDEIDPRKFDDLIESISKSKTDVVIDNGASTFVALAHYLISNQIPALLKNSGIGGKTSSCVTSRHFDYGKSRRVFISRSNRPYGLICSHTNGVNAA